MGGVANDGSETSISGAMMGAAENQHSLRWSYEYRLLHLINLPGALSADISAAWVT
jgi:hypothetical protein